MIWKKVPWSEFFSLILAEKPLFFPDFPDWKKSSKFSLISLIGGNPASVGLFTHDKKHTNIRIVIFFWVAWQQMEVLTLNLSVYLAKKEMDPFTLKFYNL